MNTHIYPNDAWDVLSPRLSKNRYNKMLAVAKGRLFNIATVLQDVHDPHNIAACLRSAEAFGIQNCHVIAPESKFRASGVARGSAKWLSVHKHSDVQSCAEVLHAAGFNIFAAMPSSQSLELTELDLSSPIAVVFGNEHRGVDDSWEPWLDGAFTIPMHGMVESLNISVSAAVTMHQLSHRYRLGNVQSEELSAAQRELLNIWICEQIPHWELEYERRRDP